MPLPQKLFKLALEIQASHGWPIKVLYRGRTMPGRDGRWVVYIGLGAEFEGTLQASVAWLQGYQAGYLGGRRYTREESDALLDEAKSFIKEPRLVGVPRR